MRNIIPFINNKERISTQYLADGIILGKGAFKPFEGNNNVIVIGSSGTGKSYSFVEPNLLQANSSFVVSDAKGQLLKDVGGHLLSQGYDIKILNLCDLSKSMHYNPFHYISRPDDILYLGHCVTSSTVTGEKTHTNDTFWQASSMMLFNAIAFYLYENIQKKQRTLSNVIKLLELEQIGTEYNDDCKSRLDLIFDSLKEKNPSSPAITFHNMYRIGAERTRATVVISLQANLMQYAIPEVRELTSYDELELDQLGKKKMALFVVYDDTDPTKNFLSNILYSQIFKILCRQAQEFPSGQLDVPVQIFLDDFFNVSIPDFEQYIATIRSRRISTCIMLQDESQLKAKYGICYNSIIANCGTYLFTGTTDLRAAQEQSERFHMSPDEIRQIGEDEFLVSCNGVEKKVQRFSPDMHPMHPTRERFDFEAYVNTHTKESKDSFEMEEAQTTISEESLEDVLEKAILESKSTSKEAVTAQKFKSELLFESVSKRMHLHDSASERHFYSLLRNEFARRDTKGVVIHTMVPLSNLIDAESVSSRRAQLTLKLMHCDFVVRDEISLRPICGIEIDGPLHERTEKYIVNDNLKDFLFNKCGIPLIRIPTTEIYDDSVDFDKIFYYINNGPILEKKTSNPEDRIRRHEEKIKTNKENEIILNEYKEMKPECNSFEQTSKPLDKTVTDFEEDVWGVSEIEFGERQMDSTPPAKKTDDEEACIPYFEDLEDEEISVKEPKEALSISDTSFDFEIPENATEKNQT